MTSRGLVKVLVLTVLAWLSFARAEHAAPLAIPLESEFVMPLTNDTFQKVVASHRAVLILFHAHWADVSNQFRPTFVKVARVLQGRVKLVIVDAEAEEWLTSKFKVKSFPSMKLVAKGTVTPYPKAGARTVDHIVAWAKVRATVAPKKWEKAEEAAIIECTEDNFDGLLEKHPLLFVMFHAPSCEHCEQLRPEWATAGRHLQGRVPMGRINLQENRMGARFSITQIPTLKLFINKVPRFDYDGEHNAVDLVTWVEGFETGRMEDDVMELEADDFEEALEANPLIMVQFYASEGETHKALYLEWVRAAHSLIEEVPLARIDVESEAKIAQDYNIDVAGVRDFPIVKIFRKGVAEDYLGSQHEKALVKFARGIVAQTAEAEL